jgi:hypothetical protein
MTDEAGTNEGVFTIQRVGGIVVDLVVDDEEAIIKYKIDFRNYISMNFLLIKTRFIRVLTSPVNNIRTVKKTRKKKY